MKQIKRAAGMRQFTILWASQAVSTLGSAMTSYALILWVYGEKNTASSMALLSVFTYLPSTLLCFFAGAVADRWDKKRIMLTADFIAALGTATIFLLYANGRLEVWHLYAVNFFISCMNAFQKPASYVAVSLLAPREQYNRVGGMQALSNAFVTILAPALATVAMAFGGLGTVLTVDLLTFAIAFFVLLLFIRLPQSHSWTEEAREGIFRSCRNGLQFLKKNRDILSVILFFTAINFFAYLTGTELLPALILFRTGGNETALGVVSACVGAGALAGGAAVTLLRAPKKRMPVILLSCGLSFLFCNIPWALSQSLPVWGAGAFLGNFLLPFLNANLTALMRIRVPVSMQGRVFATRDSIQYCTIPLGMLLGGVLADHVFEPFMQGTGTLQGVFSGLVGSGAGSGVALMYLCTGVAGIAVSFLALRWPCFQAFAENGTAEESGR